jgi:hypothetical protein
MSCVRRNATCRDASAHEFVGWHHRDIPMRGVAQGHGQYKGYWTAIQHRSPQQVRGASPWKKWPRVVPYVLLPVLIWSGTRRRLTVRGWWRVSTLRTLQGVVSLRAFGSAKAHQSCSWKQIYCCQDGQCLEAIVCSCCVVPSSNYVPNLIFLEKENTVARSVGPQQQSTFSSGAGYWA